VVGVGVGLKNSTGPLSVIVNVTKKLPEDALAAQDVIPYAVEGFPTDVVETGIIRALSRPAFGGDSIGHYAITAGTLGCVVRRNGQRVILSNNHVLANSNDAEIGDPILAPGPYDGGEYPEDLIGELEDFQPIFFGDVEPSECPIANRLADALNLASRLLGRKTRLVPIIDSPDNLVDAAVATPLDDDQVSDEIRVIGPPTGLEDPKLGQLVSKSGRTTGYTTGVVLQIETTIQVQYGAGKVATFRDQVLASGMSQPGDSGSAVLSGTKLVGLLFAGSDLVTVFNRIDHVFEALNLEL
jgi:S1-C subfamily serine protease